MLLCVCVCVCVCVCGHVHCMCMVLYIHVGRYKCSPPSQRKHSRRCVCVFVCMHVWAYIKLCTCTLSLPGVKSAAAKAENTVAVVFSPASLVRAWVSNVPFTLANIYSPSPLNVYLLPSRVLIWGSPHHHAV